MKINPISRKQNIVIQELEKELLVYDLKTNKAFCLNETSTLVFQLCDGKRTVIEIADVMSVRLKKLVSEDFVQLALNELKKDNLLENSDDLDNYFAGMSRREMVRKVGLASMIALPVIASVVAPSALMAQSCQGRVCGTGECCPAGGVCYVPQLGFPMPTVCCPSGVICVNVPTIFCCPSGQTCQVVFIPGIGPINTCR